MAGENPLARPLFKQIASEFAGVKNLGIWGDPAHQKRKSDHNTGDAIDIGFGSNFDTGRKILQRVLQQPGTKYAILGRDVYYPDGRVSRGGTKMNHDTHVHVSFLRDGKSGSGYAAGAGSTAGMSAAPQPAAPQYRLSDYAGTTIYNHLRGIAQTVPDIDLDSIYIQGGRIYAKRAK